MTSQMGRQGFPAGRGTSSAAAAAVRTRDARAYSELHAHAFVKTGKYSVCYDFITAHLAIQ